LTLAIELVRPDQEAVCAVISHRMALTLMEAPKMSFAEAMAQLPFARDRLAYYLDPSKCEGRVWVARLDGENIGHTMGMVDRDSDGPFGYMGTFFVVPSFRRLGIARALLRTNADWLRSLGLRRIVYRSAEDYLPMRALLLSEGFVQRSTMLQGFAEFEQLSLNV
jgi:GNAT superfamily N-acetyltransferase